MNIKVYGKGCAKCKLLEENAKDAAEQLQVKAEIEKITEMDKIVDAGIMMTPGLEIDGKIVSTGRVLTVDEIKKLMKGKP